LLEKTVEVYDQHYGIISKQHGSTVKS